MTDAADIARAIAAIGPVFGPEILQRTRALYRPLVAPFAPAPDEADLPYGPDARNRLDLFRPREQSGPVLLFVHGGGFVGGDKAEDPLFYANIGRYFADHGFLAATANYRRAGTHGWPAASEDVAAMVDWLMKNAAAYGGDPARIFVIGQSAGASHVAGYLFLPQYADTRRESLAGVALLSGFYRAAPPLEGGPRVYFGDDVSLWAERSPLTHVSARHPRLMLSLAEFDPPDIAAHTLDLARALNLADGRPPELRWFGGHNHVSTVHGLGLDGDAVGPALLDFFALAGSVED